MEDQALRLSRYNESLGNRNSTSMKFDWMQLLGDPGKSGSNDKAGLGSNNMGRSLRECDLEDKVARLNSGRRNDGESEFSGLSGFERKPGDENPGPRLALSSRSLGDPVKPGTNDKNHIVKELDLKVCHGVKATRLDSERKHYRESEYSGLGRLERKLMDDNPIPGVALSSRGSDESVVHKSLSGGKYEEENSSMRHSRDDNNCMELSRARPTNFGTGPLTLPQREFPGSLGSNPRISSGRDRFNVEMIDSTIIHDALDGKLCGKSSITRTYIPADNIPVGEEHEYDTYDESWRMKSGNVFRESDDFHVSASVADDYSHDYFDSSVDKLDKCYDEELSGENRVWYSDSYFGGNKILGNNDLNMSPTEKWYNDIVDLRNTYEREEHYFNQRSPLSGDDHCNERSELSPWSEYGQHSVPCDHGSLLLEEGHTYERSGTFPFMENDIYLDESAGDLQQRLAESDSCLINESSLLLKRKHDMEGISTNSYTGNTTSMNEGRGVKYHQHGAFEQVCAEDMDSFNLSKKRRYSHSQFTQPEQVSYRTTERHVTEHSSAGKDIMKRLGPRYQDIHGLPSHLHVNTPESSVRKRLGPVTTSRPSVLQRLGPGPRMNQAKVFQVKTQKSKKLYQRACYDENYLVPVEEASIADVISDSVEPLENSEEFKQLVRCAYFRFVKQLNENSSQRRRILEQGKAGRLKCLVCGSNSREFVDTKSLVVHTFYSIKGGLRALHLGFHQALCMLMGWKNKISDGRKWFCELLSDGEASSLKEDHIIWPPVVIIHNSSLNSNDFDERVIVSIEALASMLRGMGFVETIKVCRGRPANHSILAVIFNSTLSGLEAAERLHNFYSKTKHGRSDLEYIRSCSSSCSKEASRALEKKAEHVLYGYLGIAEDLDKLEYETKKRCLVKSKKEIQSIAMHP
ncbi:uncharacterized protein LOC141689431 [Apium graveolens]|uniref:uncharacterized protein LOC141689431 n=1 Tax=Apium graveolens TaxID=4045 RepID=UPI003D797322